MKKKFAILFLFAILFTLILTSCSNANPTPAPDAQPTSDLDGKSLVQTRCTVCHTTQRIEAKKASLEQWQLTVTKMIGKGAKLNAEEETVLVQYLAATYK